MRWLLLSLLLIASPARAQIVAVVGDSTAATKPSIQTCCIPNTQGWIPYLSTYLSGVTIYDRALDGIDTSTYLAYLGGTFWTATLGLLPNQIILQLGTNDEAHALAIATYKANLHTFVTDARANGSQIIFVTPFILRVTVSQHTQGGDATTLIVPGVKEPYATAMIAQAAAESPVVPVIDLHAWSKAMYLSVGFAKSHSIWGWRCLDVWCQVPAVFDWQFPVWDEIHMNDEGANRAAQQIAGGLRTASPTLAAYLLARYRPTHSAAGMSIRGGRM